MVKALPDAAAPGGAGSPARPGAVPLDEGRPWAGDLYDEGPVTDPGEAYAAFADAAGEDVEAWVDRAEDGTLIGWVREGDDVYRYSDPEAWAIDVDGAGMQMTAGPEGATAPDANLDAGAPVEAEEAEEADSAVDELPDAPVGFDEESDPATTEEDPTDDLEDPTDLPSDEVTEEETNPFDGLSDDDALLDDGEADAPDDAGEDPASPDAAPDTDAEETGDEPGEDERVTVAPEDLEQTDTDPAEDAEAAEQGDADEAGEGGEGEDDEERKRRLFGGKVQVKHMPGQHNQDSHGNWTASLGVTLPKGRRASTGGGGGSSPKGEAGKARLSPADIAEMSDEELDAVTTSPDLWHDETLMAAAEEWDRRAPVHDQVAAEVEKYDRGTPERAGALASVIPDDWAAWVALGAKSNTPPSTPSKKEQVEAAWRDYIYQLWLQAEGAPEVNGQLLNAAARESGALQKHNLSIEALFDGSIPRGLLRKLASKELIDWLDKHRMTKQQWLAEFYPGYAKRLRQTGGPQALGENG